MSNSEWPYYMRSRIVAGRREEHAEAISGVTAAEKAVAEAARLVGIEEE